LGHEFRGKPVAIDVAALPANFRLQQPAVQGQGDVDLETRTSSSQQAGRLPQAVAGEAIRFLLSLAMRVRRERANCHIPGLILSEMSR
jgi:hypothetical protein